MKEKIMIVECISSAVNYVKDIYDEGYEPVLLEPYCQMVARPYMRAMHDHDLDLLPPGTKRPRIVSAKRTYEDTLKIVKEIKPILIIPGSDAGIELATKLSHDLGLIGNDPENLPKMRNKFICQQALAKAGIRSIQSKVTSDYEEALDFYKKMKAQGKKMILKPVSGIASLGVYVVDDLRKLKKAFSFNQGFIGKMYNGGSKNDVLLQEFIDGEEYYFNTVSCRGKHKTTMIVKYHKIIRDGRKLYDTNLPIPVDSEEYRLIEDYGKKVLDAIGIEYGAVHSEIMVDKDGPVLIEANCRLCGGNMSASFQNEFMGSHESKESLLSYLRPDYYLENCLDEKVKIIKPYIVKYISLQNNTFVFHLKIEELFEKLPGYRYYYSHSKFGFLPKTTDLSSALAYVFFAFENEKGIQNILDYIHDLEENHPEKFYKGFRLL